MLFVEAHLCSQFNRMAFSFLLTKELLLTENSRRHSHITTGGFMGVPQCFLGSWYTNFSFCCEINVFNLFVSPCPGYVPHQSWSLPPAKDKFIYVLQQRSPNVFNRGPFKQQFEGRTAWAKWLFRDMLHSTKSTSFSQIYYFFIVDKTASRAGFCPRAVVWRPLFYRTSHRPVFKHRSHVNNSEPQWRARGVGGDI